MSDAYRPRIVMPSERAILHPLELSARTERPHRHLVSAGLALLDGAVLFAATLAASTVHLGTALGPVEMGGMTETALGLSTQMVAAWLLMIALAGLYAYGRSWGSAELTRAVRALALGTAGLVLVRYLVHFSMPSRVWLLMAWGAATVLMLIERLTVRHVVARMHARGRMVQRTLVVGTNLEASGVVKSLMGRRTDGFAPVGCVSSSLKDRLSLDYTEPVIPTLGNARDILRVIAEHDIDVVVLVASAFDHEVLERIIAEVATAEVDVFVSSSLADVLLSRVSVREVAGVPLISLRGISLSPANLLLKRSFDLAASLGIIVLGMPVWIVTALLIKITSRGPVFYSQERIGLHGKPFSMYKFRSMVPGADMQLDELRKSKGIATGPMFKLTDDPRVTPIGRWMRKFSIDEFPQLINVVKGEMSLVGPRPPLHSETVYYNDRHCRRLEVVPGITGLWQVSGRSDLSFDEMVDLDLFYTGNWQLGLDLSILMRTIPAVVLTKGAW